MKQRQIDLFFQYLDEGLGLPAEVILAGASAGSLMGHIRPSLDIDFEITLKRKTAQGKMKSVRAIDEASKKTGLAVNYSENIGGWSVIDYLDYRKTAVPYKRFGKINVKLLHPEYWTIGKMARFLEPDVQDMAAIIRKQKLKPESLIRLWARAARSSSLSLELGQFRDHVTLFLKRCGRRLWKRNSKELMAFFQKEIHHG